MQFKEFGVRLNFTPTIAGDLIRLKVRPEVSELDFNNGVTLDGFRIPALQTRRAETEVELRDGQSFAVAGLIDNTAQTDRAAIPILSQLPVIGALFKSKAERQERTELLVLITPRLVRPLNPDEVPPLPTMPGRFLPPGDELSEKFEGGGGTVDGPAVDAVGCATSAVSEAMSTEAFDQVGARRDADHGGASRIAVLIAFNTFVIDYGVMWVGRRQAQNAADAGALAGAVSMAFDANGWTDRTPAGPARTAAQQMALTNVVWGQAPDVDIATDVFFTDTPAAMCAPDPDGNTPCIRVDVYRNQARGNALPALFGGSVGLLLDGRPSDGYGASRRGQRQRLPQAVGSSRQVARRLRRDGADRARQHVDARRRRSRRTPGRATPTRRWRTRTSTRRPRRTVPGTGFTVDADLGLEMTLKAGSPQDAIAPGVFFPVGCRAMTAPAPAATITARTSRAATVCRSRSATRSTTENGNMIGPTAQGVNDLIALDPQRRLGPGHEYGHRQLRAGGDALCRRIVRASSPFPFSTPATTTPASSRGNRTSRW